MGYQECPILGATWERRSAVRCGQKRSDDVNTAVSTRLTCRNVLDQEPCSRALSVRDEEAAGSNPATPTSNPRWSGFLHSVETRSRSFDRHLTVRSDVKTRQILLLTVIVRASM